MSCWPPGGADCDDEARSDEQRRSHLRPIRNSVISADFHRHRLGESEAKGKTGPKIARPSAPFAGLSDVEGVASGVIVL